MAWGPGAAGNQGSGGAVFLCSRRGGVSLRSPPNAVKLPPWHSAGSSRSNVSGGGVPKLAVAEAAVTADGVAGDRQNDQLHHGGPERAVSIYAAEVIAALAAEGHPIGAGTTGENLTVSGIPWGEVLPGAELRVGPVRLVVTRYVTPCVKIAASFVSREFMRISNDAHPGWSRVYARVLEGGVVRVARRCPDAGGVARERPFPLSHSPLRGARTGSATRLPLLSPQGAPRVAPRARR